ncbi:hypothetical protein PF005_g30336 [Phytophthora fragariae]|uniref:Uncharacterized protein n=2 Tax=Phytophthora fragariae TaxID=53985 RepID=A0A6A4BP08_9STRA|nr:hypothetical protein PF003_g29016 [Phytophthora fragariae]KAE8922417.1 hypothetical protein PF009_g27321 [Phytophthora fragariae]KAE8963956.1 hypothetical protein PF011_g28845 [Phytophthora fragariae]KAE9063194.1 hypothetical protein PF010_g29095 [Phytophthora fragariae]KAE9072163.1 hypothetical protein PF007_g26281 [Phytophthora fragariae]
MELLQAIQNDVLKHKEEEAVNQFFTTAGFREFILTTHPNPDVMVTLYLCCLHAERLQAGNGTRVTLTDAAQREVFEQTSSAINDLTPLKRKPYLVQVTVWDAKQNKVCYGKAIIDFKPGAVYKFTHVDGVGFYADIAKGSVQYERGNDFKICETEPPLKKRKLPSEISPVPANAKTHASVATPGMSGANAGDGDVIMTSGSKGDGNHTSVTTRNKRHP